MYAKFLVRQLLPHIQLHKLYHGSYRSFGSASSILNDSTKRSASSDNQLVIPSIGAPASPRMVGEFHKSFRKLHAGKPCLMSEDEGAEKENSNITYSIVPRERSRIVSEFLIRYYHQMEPMTMALGMPMEEIGHWFHDFIRMSMFASVTDVCVQAIDESARRRVGVLASIIVDPLIKAPASMVTFLNSKKHPVNMVMEEFYDKLEEGVSEASYREPSEGTPRVKTLDHMFVSIDPDFAGLGISSKMVGLAETIAASIINCRIGYVVTTSEFSYKVFKKQGYEVQKEIKYADYTNSKGEKIFADKLELMKPHTTCRSMTKQLKNYYD